MLRDDLGQLTFAPQVKVVEDFETSAEIFRQHQHFQQWDGSFITADGRLALPGQLENGSAADAIPTTSASRLQPESDVGPFCFAQTPVFLDEPEHTRFRQLLSKTWQTGSTVRALESRTALLAEDLLSTAATGRPVEFIRSVATPLSATVLAWFFGGSPDPWIELALERQQSHTQENEAAVLPSVTAFQQHVWDLLGRRDRVPEADAVSRMVHRSVCGDSLRPAEIATLMLQTALVSNETVIRLLGSLAATVSERPALRMPSDGGTQSISQLAGSALRDHSPQRGVFRRAARRCTAGETEFQPGTGIFVDIKRANQDSSAAVAAGLAPAAASGGGHLSFGAGIHRCPGAALATMEVLVLARALCARPSLTIVGDGSTEDPVGLLEGPTSLWLDL